MTAAKLGLGGHSFIAELGNDPQASFEEQCAIVAACLDSGVGLIDTTYYQERVALGDVLDRLGRRDEAEIMAWNFFKRPGKEGELVGFTPYEPEHLAAMLAELRTDRIDVLVVHVHDDEARLRAELALAARWVSEGRVKRVALGMARPEHLLALPEGHPVTAVLAPYNAFYREAGELFRLAKERGIATIALSPFVRGWRLDELGADKDDAADILLRWAATQPAVDRVIVSMRRVEWVDANLRAVRSGPLSEAESARLRGWLSRGG
ncbi:aldo/keto reductase [Paenibacillus sp. MWE-103]|uniref:Aldo/keto reductase n=1 Tax=Paenibacillus artemisiicola TaxID=1172618 RepID=A0ABS3W398_9BACL|nr:aldo/keto reductase [Paenibacillus artemisiicola]MBO7742771.1 aldo/keto reductase [Paenibacillus artemisiicola]